MNKLESVQKLNAIIKHVPTYRLSGVINSPSCSCVEQRQNAKSQSATILESTKPKTFWAQDDGILMPN
jgi:hypothetical protein